jgi:hypothetical protein
MIVPISGFILSAQRRPTTSVAPPGANGTMSRIGRSGYRLWAKAESGAAAVAASDAKPVARTSRRFMGETSQVPCRDLNRFARGRYGLLVACSAGNYRFRIVR